MTRTVPIPAVGPVGSRPRREGLFDTSVWDPASTKQAAGRLERVATVARGEVPDKCLRCGRTPEWSAKLKSKHVSVTNCEYCGSVFAPFDYDGSVESDNACWREGISGTRYERGDGVIVSAQAWLGGDHCFVIHDRLNVRTGPSFATPGSAMRWAHAWSPCSCIRCGPRRSTANEKQGRQHVPWSCMEDESCGRAWCDRHGGELFLCAACNQAEAELEPTCPGPTKEVGRPTGGLPVVKIPSTGILGVRYKPLPGVRDDCMTCFVRGVQCCPKHRGKGLDLNPSEPEPKKRPWENPALVKPRHPDPLEGWDVILGHFDPGDPSNWIGLRYVRPDGVVVFSKTTNGHHRFRVEHPVYGELADYSHNDPAMMMAWADLKIPRGDPR